MKLFLSKILSLLILFIFPMKIFAGETEAADSTSFVVEGRSAEVKEFHWGEFAIPAATATLSGLFVKTPKLVQARQWVQNQLANSTGQPRTHVDDYLQYLPIVESYGLYFGGMKGEHNLLDRTVILAMSYATSALITNTLKWGVDEVRPNNPLQFNSFPSNHTATAFVGAEFLRREYWNSNKWLAMSGYAVAITVGYLRLYNNRHWINDVVCGASIGYLSTTFAYWLYPKIFHKSAQNRSTPYVAADRKPEVSVYAVPTISTDYFGATAMISF